jgi:lysophospholipase L1-like esterase
MRLGSVKKRILYACFLIIFTCLAAEILLRIYNPFATSVTGDRITLHTNTEVLIKNDIGNNGLDKETLLKRNSLGFRGAEPPENFREYLTIVTVGGSTTECLFVPEEKTWPGLLLQQLQAADGKVWLNNAGLNGHSTYGHLKLMKDYIVKLQPDYCLFLIGCNDVNRTDLTSSDSTINDEYQDFMMKLAKHSRLANVSLNFYRHYLARKRELVNDRNFSLTGKEKRIIDSNTMQVQLDRQAVIAKQFRSRVQQLVQVCREAGIEPVFITQPCLLGDTTDDVTGVSMGTFPFNEGNGRLTWEILQLYNDETRSICKEANVPVIDLAAQLPKSSRYFYDVYHFNNEGCRRVSEIIYQNLKSQIPNFK